MKRQDTETREDAVAGIFWIAPVLLSLGENRVKRVEGPHDALAVLQRQWRRAKAGPHHQAALTNCRRAVNALRGLEISRESFIAAAIEAGLLCHGNDKAGAGMA